MWLKQKKKQCPSHHHFYRFLWLPSKTGLVYYCFTHTHISHLQLSTRNDLRRLWRLKKHCRLWLGSLRQGGKFIGTVAGIPSLELEKSMETSRGNHGPSMDLRFLWFSWQFDPLFPWSWDQINSPQAHQVGLGPWPYHGHLCAASGVPARVCGCCGPDRWPSHWHLAMLLGKAELHGSTAFSPLKSQRYGMIWRITNKAQRRSRLKKGVKLPSHNPGARDLTLTIRWS